MKNYFPVIVLTLFVVMTAHVSGQDVASSDVSLPTQQLAVSVGGFVPLTNVDGNVNVPGVMGFAPLTTDDGKIIPEASDGEEDTDILPRGSSEAGGASSNQMVGLKFDTVEIDEILKQYSDWTGRAIMKAPDVPAVKITLKCPKRLPKNEALLAIESVLAMYGVGLVPMGDKFIKVVQIGAARSMGMPTSLGAIDKDLEETDKLVSRIIELKHLEITEGQGVIQNLLHPYGKIVPLERINCLLITDTAMNLKRIDEILAMIDQPVEVREELRIFSIVHAKASEIQTKIEAILADSQAKETKRRVTAPSSPFGTPATIPTSPFQPMRPSGGPAGQSSGGNVSEFAPSGLDRGIIQSKVKMVADDRINSLIIITRPEQFKFFENLIKALDQSVEPDIKIKVIRLEYADAKDVVSVLNNLLSTASSKSSSQPAASPFATQAGIGAKEQKEREGGTREQQREGDMQISGKLSADVKIIADTRINALLVMATKQDMAIIEKVLQELDIRLSQVLIEVVIVEVSLTDKFQLGIDWLQRSMITYNQKNNGTRNAIGAFSGTSKEGTFGEIKDASVINKISDNTASGGSGLTYYFTFFDYNIDVVLNMLASDSTAKILSAPIILTTDNKVAKILVGEKRPIVTATSISGGGVQQSSYEYTPIGIELEVTPHINKKGFVVMEIKQKIDNKGEDVKIDQNNVPVITTRDFTASISINDGRTVVIGGLISTERNKLQTKVPFLGDIPLVGALFRSDDEQDLRRELLVLITPYVLDTPEKAYNETARRHSIIDGISNIFTKGWSASELAYDPDASSNASAASGEKKQAFSNVVTIITIGDSTSSPVTNLVFDFTHTNVLSNTNVSQ
jgi:general secretion pathway protein D